MQILYQIRDGILIKRSSRCHQYIAIPLAISEMLSFRIIILHYTNHFNLTAWPIRYINNDTPILFLLTISKCFTSMACTTINFKRKIFSETDKIIKCFLDSSCASNHINERYKDLLDTSIHNVVIKSYLFQHLFIPFYYTQPFRRIFYHHRGV